MSTTMAQARRRRGYAAAVVLVGDEAVAAVPVITTIMDSGVPPIDDPKHPGMELQVVLDLTGQCPLTEEESRGN